jgi:hypothetical protein
VYTPVYTTVHRLRLSRITARSGPAPGPRPPAPGPRPPTGSAATGGHQQEARIAGRGGYALPVGNGEAEAVGAEDGTAVGVGAALGAAGLAEVGVGEAEAAAHPLSPLGTGTGVAGPAADAVGIAVGLAVATGSGVAQDGLVGLAEATGSGVPAGAVGRAVGVPAGAEGAADAEAWWAAFLLAWTAPVPAVAADAQPASSATPATVPSAQAAVPRVLGVVTFICSSS